MIQSLERSMNILEVLKDRNASCTIAELSEAVDLPPSTVHRILATFCEKNYVLRDERSHTYRLGPALISLGKAAANGIKLQDAAHPVLASLTAETNEDSYLMIPVGEKGLVLERFDGPSHLKVIEEFGYEMYLHCGAIRKTLLAWQTPEFIEDYIENVIVREDAFPHTEPDKLRNDLKKIRSEGYGISFGDYVDNAYGIGAPVFDCDGNLTASIGIIIPKVEVENDESLSLLAGTVKSHAGRLSQNLGYDK